MTAEEWKQIGTVMGFLTVVVGLFAALLRVGEHGGARLRSFWREAGRALYWVLMPVHGPWTVTRRQRRQEREARRWEAKLEAKLDEFLVGGEERDRKISSLQESVEAIQWEISPNGFNSMKDVSTLLLGWWKKEIRERPYPLFLCGADGRVFLASAQLTRMLGLRDEGPLMDLNWRRYIYQEDQPEFLENVQRCAANRADFRAVCRWCDDRGAGAGEWQTVGDVLLKASM